MEFTKRLRERVRNGTITRTVRIWKNARVKEGNSYRFQDGWICVDTMREISLDDITASIARECGFEGIIDLLKTAQHGNGTKIYLIDFHFVAGEKP